MKPIAILPILICSFTGLFGQQGTIIFNNSATPGLNSIGPFDANKSLRLNGERNIELVINEENQYGDAALNIWKDGIGTVPFFRVQNDGRVGIGTATPSQRLEIFNQSPFNMNEGSEFQDHISLHSVEHGQGSFFGGITWRSAAGRRRAAIAATREHPDADFIGLAFFTRGTDGPGPMYESMRITRNGAVGIGTTAPDATLAVKGDIHAEEVRVDLNVPGPDYVFEEDYDLPSLSSVQNHIRKYRHLPGIPPAKVMEANGIEVGKMNMLLLKKVEELTLYVIQQEGKITELREGQNSKEKDLEVKINRLMLQQGELLERLEAQGRRIKELSSN